MSLFTWSASARDLLLLFDVGSGSVGGAIALHAKAEPPTILYSTRSEILFKHDMTAKRLLSLCQRALAEVVLALVHEGFARAGFPGHRPQVAEALVSLSAPWTMSKTSILHVSNKKPTRITDAIFRALLAEDRKATEASMPSGGVQIEHKLVNSVINGYETEDPYGKIATTAEFTVLSGYSLPKVVESISDSISHLIHPKTLSFHSFSFLSFAVLRELFPEHENFVFVDVSGEQTEVSVVKKGISLETVSYPYGKNHLIRALEKKGGLPPSGAESFVKLYNEGMMKGALSEKGAQVLDLFKKEWLRRFLRVTAMFSEQVFLPQVLFLTADSHIAPLIKQSIGESNFAEFTLASSPFQTVFVDESVLAPYVRANGDVPHDPFLSLIALYAGRLRG
jgi:hypothetical protein